MHEVYFLNIFIIHSKHNTKQHQIEMVIEWREDRSIIVGVNCMEKEILSR